MDEFIAITRARELVRKAAVATLPVDIKAYLSLVNAKLKADKTMGDGEAGSTLEMGGKYFISVNGTERPERQRFTACHEIAHIVLGLPSEHDHGVWWSYSKRPPNEILCDGFAAELLLPYSLFKPLVDAADIGFRTVSQMATDYEASLTATASRFATFSTAPCAFVLSEGGTVRYTAMSKGMREAKARVSFSSLPAASLAEALRRGGRYDGPSEIAADMWFEDWRRGGTLLEDSRYSNEWNQTLSLLWFEDEEVPEPQSDRHSREYEEEGLAELDGNLPWPGKRRRR
jgi:hypothetical protein